VEVREIALSAGVPQTVNMPGRLFILIATSAAVDITFRGEGGQTLREKGRSVQAGYKSFPADWNDVQDRFTGVRLESVTGQTIQIGVSERAADYEPRTTVTVEKPDSIATIADVTVSTVVVQLAPSNSDRKTIVIQNVHATGIMRVGDSANVGTSRGIRLQAGQSIVFESTSAIHAIREGATDATAAILEETI